MTVIITSSVKLSGAETFESDLERVFLTCKYSSFPTFIFDGWFVVLSNLEQILEPQTRRKAERGVS